MFETNLCITYTVKQLVTVSFVSPILVTLVSTLFSGGGGGGVGGEWGKSGGGGGNGGGGGAFHNTLNMFEHV